MTNIHSLLTTDHERLERIFCELENAVEAADQPTIQRCWDAFERGLLAHLEAEEQVLFPLLDSDQPDLVERARREHERLRALLADMGVRTDLHLLRKDVAAALLDLLRKHAAWEDQTLYPLAAAKTSEPSSPQRSLDEIGRDEDALEGAHPKGGEFVGALDARSPEDPRSG